MWHCRIRARRRKRRSGVRWWLRSFWTRRNGSMNTWGLSRLGWRVRKMPGSRQVSCCSNNNHTGTTTAINVLWQLYKSTCVSWHLQLRTGRFCWRKVSVHMPLLTTLATRQLVMDGVWVVDWQNADITDTLHIGDIAMPTIFWLSVYEVHIGSTWRILLNRPCVVALWSYVKLLWPLVVIITVVVKAMNKWACRDVL